MSEIEFLIKLRDAAQMIADTCNDRLEKLAPPEVKVETEVDPKEIEAAVWTPYKRGSGSWAFSDRLPTLKAALKKAGKKLDFEGYRYQLQGEQDRFVARYPKKK